MPRLRSQEEALQEARKKRDALEDELNRLKFIVYDNAATTEATAHRTRLAALNRRNREVWKGSVARALRRTNECNGDITPTMTSFLARVQSGGPQIQGFS